MKCAPERSCSKLSIPYEGINTIILSVKCTKEESKEVILLKKK